MGEFSMSHWLLIAVILLLFFGPSKLPQLGKSLGQAINGFKAGLNAKTEEENNGSQSSPSPQSRIQAQNTQEAEDKEKKKTTQQS